MCQGRRLLGNPLERGLVGVAYFSYGPHSRELKAYDMAAFCVRLGLRFQGDDEVPFRSKHV